MRDTLILSDIRYRCYNFTAPTRGRGLGGRVVVTITLLPCFSKFQISVFPLIKGLNQARQIWLNQTVSACRVNDKLSFMIILTGYWFFLPQFYEDNYRCSVFSVQVQFIERLKIFLFLQNYHPQEHKMEVISTVWLLEINNWEFYWDSISFRTILKVLIKNILAAWKLLL